MYDWLVKNRINISMHPDVKAIAKQVSAARKIHGLSPLIVQLILEDHERRTGIMMIPKSEPEIAKPAKKKNTRI